MKQRQPEGSAVSGPAEHPLTLADRLRESERGDSGKVRIVFLGDSFTQGVGVQLRQAFPHQTDQLLKQRWAGQCFVMNAGNSGADLLTEWLNYSRFRGLLRADVVVQVVSPNDLDIDLYKDMVPIARVSSDRFWPSRYLVVFEQAESAIRGLLFQRWALDYCRGGGTPERRERSWRVVAYQIEATKRLAEEDGAVYVLVQFPELWLVAKGKNYPLEEVNRQMAALASRLNVPFLDLLKVFRGLDCEHLCAPEAGDHPGVEAHLLAAEAICDFLTRDVLPRVSTRPVSRPTSSRSVEAARLEQIAHFRRTLELAPDCVSARFRLDELLGVKTLGGTDDPTLRIRQEGSQ
jgi:hypothetical protein